MHKLHRDFQIQTDHLFPARQPDLVIVDNNNNKKMNLVTRKLVDQRVKIKESENRDKYQEWEECSPMVWETGV